MDQIIGQSTQHFDPDKNVLKTFGLIAKKLCLDIHYTYKMKPSNYG